MAETYTVDQRLRDLRDAFQAIGDLLVGAKDMHLVDPEKLEALIHILSDELDRARIQAADELAELRGERRDAEAA